MFAVVFVGSVDVDECERVYKDSGGDIHYDEVSVEGGVIDVLKDKLNMNVFAELLAAVEELAEVCDLFALECKVIVFAHNWSFLKARSG